MMAVCCVIQSKRNFYGRSRALTLSLTKSDKCIQSPTHRIRKYESGPYRNQQQPAVVTAVTTKLNTNVFHRPGGKKPRAYPPSRKILKKKKINLHHSFHHFSIRSEMIFRSQLNTFRTVDCSACVCVCFTRVLQERATRTNYRRIDDFIRFRHSTGTHFPLSRDDRAHRIRMHRAHHIGAG